MPEADILKTITQSTYSLMTYMTETGYQLNFDDTSEKGELLTTEHYASEVTSATSSMELAGADNALLTLKDAGHTLSSTASGDSVNYLSAVRFDLPEELNRRYRGWRS